MPAISAVGLKAHRVDDSSLPNSIINDIFAYTKKAKVLLADLTGNNPNVLYELGLAHAHGKPVILIAEKLDELPFDLRSLRVIPYDRNAPNWRDVLKKKIESSLQAVMNSPADAAHPAFVKSAASGSNGTPTLRHNSGGEGFSVQIWKEYPPSYATDFARAKDIWMTGLNLRRTIPSRIGDIKRVLESGGTVRVLLLDPDHDGCRDAAFQEWGHSDRWATELYREMIRDVYRALAELRNRSNQQQIKIRKIGYTFGFGVDAMRFANSRDGALYVRFYPISGIEDDRPILPLTPRNGYWYDFYRSQLQIQWERAVPWQ
jgi:hypothetical protein